MDISKFKDSATGKLVEIDRADHPKGKDWAFIPEVLPPKWKCPLDLWPLVSEARASLGELNGTGQALDDFQLLVRPLRNREALASTQIEGTFVTPEQLLLFEIDPCEPKSKGDQLADWMEVINYNRAIETGGEMIQTSPIGSHVFRSMHSLLMRGVRGADKGPGKYRDKQVQIGSTARYIPPPYTEVEPLMQNLEEYIASDCDNPLIKCFVAHYQFEAIHPFEDGNGRVGRAVLALMIYKLLGHSSPWLYLSPYFDKFQDEYFANLFQVSSVGDWRSWVEFCLNGTISQAKDSFRRCLELKKLKEEFHKRIKDKSPTARSHAIVESLFREPILRIASVQKLFPGIHYSTAKADIQKLIDAGILTTLDSERPKTFYAGAVMRIAYNSD